ncbi:MAG: hypothetical protein POELPBGB_00202 [Bacteroidia bacterium]|nr:hypothetical protein [Bacteroidia bacterium]
MKAADFFTPEVQAEVVKAIKQAEAKTSGEIRLFVEDHCKDDVLDRAAFMFEKLEMHQTELRNGVLFYLAYLDHKFAIIGDIGINAKVDNNFWNHIKDLMKEKFSQRHFKEGLSEGIILAGDALQKYFPGQHDDKNELSDHVELG